MSQAWSCDARNVYDLSSASTPNWGLASRPNGFTVNRATYATSIASRGAVCPIWIFYLRKSLFPENTNHTRSRKQRSKLPMLVDVRCICLPQRSPGCPTRLKCSSARSQTRGTLGQRIPPWHIATLSCAPMNLTHLARTYCSYRSLKQGC